LNHLDTECQRLKHICRQINGDVKFDLASITAEYDQTLAEVSTTEFLTEQFLIDMGGHELINALLNHIRQDVGIARLTYAVLVGELVKALDELYQPDFFNPDDFSELADKLV